MSIVLLEAFNLKLNDGLPDNEAIERCVASIGCLSDVARDCINSNAALLDGSVPNEEMAISLAYAGAVLTSLINEVSVELETLRERVLK